MAEEQTMIEQPAVEAFILALDCGTISMTEIPDYQQAPAYKRARACWDAVMSEVKAKGGFISARTLINYERVYCIIYGSQDEVKPHIQLAAFHILDRYRQRYSADGIEGVGFVQFSPKTVAGLLGVRRKVMSGAGKGIYSSSPVHGEAGTLHELHAPRVEKLSEMDAPPPVPYVPPFESIPLHLEPTSAKRQPTRATVGKLTRPFLERHLTYRRLVSEQTLAGLAQQYGKSSPDIKAARAVQDSVTEAIWNARLYELANSGLALISELLHDDANSSGTTIKRLPDMPVFMRFESPIDLGIYQPVWGLFFSYPQDAYQRYAMAHPGAFSLSSFSPEVVTFMDNWALNLIDEHGETVINMMYDLRRHAWKLAEIHKCQEDACVQLVGTRKALQDGLFTNWQPCEKCARFLAYFACWMPIALLAVAGEFAEPLEDDASSAMRTFEEEIVTREQRPNSGKYDEKHHRVRWHTITFDASVIVKKKTAKAGEQPSIAGERTSWYDLAVAHGTLFRVKKDIGAYDRTLVPGENKPWKYARTVKVRAKKDKWVPMSLTKLRNTVTKVVSSKHEEGKG